MKFKSSDSTPLKNACRIILSQAQHFFMLPILCNLLHMRHGEKNWTKLKKMAINMLFKIGYSDNAI